MLTFITHTRSKNKITKVSPYLRVSHSKDEPPIYVQGGKLYTDSGAEVEDVPKWFAEAIGKISPEVLKEVGFKATPEAAKTGKASKAE